MTKLAEFTMESMGKARIMALTFLFLGIGFIIAYNTGRFVDTSDISFWSRLGLLLGAVVVSITMHEGLHGIFFKLFTGKVRFGFKARTPMGPVFYATALGEMVTKRKFWLIVLAPQIATGVLLGVIFLAHLSQSVEWFLYCIMVINFLGGAMDIYMAFWLRRFPRNSLIEDTQKGIVVWQP